MIINYIKLAFRNLYRDNIYSFINIGGLAIGIGACIMLLLWVQDELSFDSFHKNANRIFRVNATFDNGGNLTWNYTPAPIARFAKEEISSVEDAARISDDKGTMLFRYKDETIPLNDKTNHIAYVDPSFFSIFDFNLVKGVPTNPFPDNNSIVLSESMARTIFGEVEAVGQVVQVNKDKEFKVAGIIRDVAANSSLDYKILFPFDILVKEYKSDYWKGLEYDWGNYHYKTFLMLHSSAVPDSVSRELASLHNRNQKDAAVGYILQPLTKLHLYGANLSEEGIQTVRIFLVVAIAILIIACINYINLATARGSQRAREVGVRKTVGADRSKLISQFLTESAILSVLALLLALVLIQLSIPFYNNLSGKNIILSFGNSTIVAFISLTLLATWLIAGIYPAVVLSSFQPVEVIRGKLTLSGGNSTFRKILVVTQFSLSIIIIIGTLVVGDQLEFIRSKKLGLDKENIFYFELGGDMRKSRESVSSELLKQPGIESVTFSNQNPLEIGNTTGDTGWDGKPEDKIFMIHPISVDVNFMKTFNMELLEGRGFTGTKADTASFILNETAVKEMEIKDPVGKKFKLWDFEGTIIGIVRDFHHRSFHKSIEPTVLISQTEWNGLTHVKTDGVHHQEAIAAAEKLWKQYNPEYPFNYYFLDASFDRMYKNEARMSKLFTAFSTIAIIISCLGLFGLATFTATQRVKEIGIRKVLGASVNQIVTLLSTDFLRLVLIALVISVPVSYYIVKQWLQDFAYHTPIRWDVFVVAGSLSLLIAFFTVSIQTIRAALGNPVDSLRSE